MYRTVRAAAIAAVLAAGVLAGCGDNPPASEPPATETQPEATSEPSGTPAAAEHTPTPEPTQDMEITIADGEVTPPPDRVSVSLGERVRIEVSSDQPDEVHLHGYDIAAEVTQSDPAVLEFAADQVGLFELEVHDQGLQLLQLVVE